MYFKAHPGALGGRLTTSADDAGLGGAETAGGDAVGSFESEGGAGVVVADVAGSAAWARSNRAPFRPAEWPAALVTPLSGVAEAIWENIISPIGAISFQRIFAIHLLVKLTACRPVTISFVQADLPADRPGPICPGLPQNRTTL
jgi:hypothetical protein